MAKFGDGGDVTAASLVAGGILILTGAVGVVYGTVRYRQVAEALRRGDSEGIGGSLGPSLAAVVLLVAVFVSAVVLLAGT